VLLTDFTPANRGTPLPFLDGTAILPTGAARLAFATGARLVPFACGYRRRTTHVHVDLDAPLRGIARDASATQASSSGDVVAVMQAVMTRISSHIRARPADWHLTGDLIHWVGATRSSDSRPDTPGGSEPP
jgi:lauroyl/myristoyl acyltransferase